MDLVSILSLGAAPGGDLGFTKETCGQTKPHLSTLTNGKFERISTHSEHEYHPLYHT